MMNIFHSKRKTGDGSNHPAEEKGNEVIELSPIKPFHKKPLQLILNKLQRL